MKIKKTKQIEKVISRVEKEIEGVALLKNNIDKNKKLVNNKNK